MGQIDKKTLVLFFIVAVLIIGIAKFVFFSPSKNTLSSPAFQHQAESKTIIPSETTKTYSDPSGFSFNYPDNLSLKNNEITDNFTYADIKLTATGVEGNLNIKIEDSKYKTLDAYFKANNITDSPKEIKLGSLKAQQVKMADKVMLASYDQGILFTIDFLQNEFWNKVYPKVLENFSFVSPAKDTTVQSDVSFEGEEVVY